MKEAYNLVLKKMWLFIFALLFILQTAWAQNLPLAPQSYGDQLIIGQVGQPPAQLNPFQVDDINMKQIARLIFGTGLIQQPDRFGQPPSIVSFILDVPNQLRGRVWRYSLNRNITFQNGIPLRNSDVKFTYDLLIKWGGHILNRELDFSNVSSIMINGDLEIQFNLKKEDNNFDLKLSDIPILSRDYYQEVARNGLVAFNRLRPFGYGPFIFARATDREIRLKSHPLYSFGRPFLDQVIYRFYENEQKMIDGFTQGNLDLIEVEDRVSAERLHQVLREEITIFPVPRPEKKLYFIQFNLGRFPFRNRKVRQAIRSAIHTNEIVNRLADRNDRVAYSIISRENKDFYRGLAESRYNPTQSLQMLQTDGWSVDRGKGILQKNSRELNFELIFEQGSYLEESIARAIKIYLAELGINVLPKPVNRQEKKNLIRRNQFTAVINTFSYYENADYEAVKIFYKHVLRKEKPFSNYSNQMLERLFKQADMDPAMRKSAIERFQIFLHRQVPVIPLYFNNTIFYAVRNRFRNIRISFISGKTYFHRLNPFENWFVPKPLQKYR